MVHQLIHQLIVNKHRAFPEHLLCARPCPLHCTGIISNAMGQTLLPTPLTDGKAKGKRGKFAQIHVATGIPGPKCFPSTPNHHTSVPTLSEDHWELEPDTWPSSWQCRWQSGHTGLWPMVGGGHTPAVGEPTGHQGREASRTPCGEDPPTCSPLPPFVSLSAKTL